MSKMNDKHRDKREKLSELRVEQLENLLTIGGKLPEDERSNAFYDAVEAAILAKEAAQPGGRIADVDDAWQQLLQKPAAPAMQALVGAGKKPRLRSAHRLVSAAALIAVMITLLVSIAVLAMDFSDVDAPKIVATWDDAFFRFSGEGKTLADYEEYPYEAGDSFAEPLREILYAYKFAVSVDPALLPAGTTMEGLETHLDPKAKLEYAFANCTFILPDGEEVFFSAMRNPGSASSRQPKDEKPVLQYYHGDMTFYLYSNLTQYIAVWTDGDVELKIRTTASQEVLLAFIKAIESNHS